MLEAECVAQLDAWIFHDFPAFLAAIDAPLAETPRSGASNGASSYLS